MLGQGWLNSAAGAALVAVVPLALVFGLWLVIFRRSAAPRLAELKTLNAQLSAALAEKTAAEQALLLSDAHFRAAFESHAVGQVHYDPLTGVTIRANRAYAAMLGYAPEELVGMKAADVTHPDDRGRGRYADLIGGGLESYAREKRHIRKDGSIVWGRVSATLVRRPDSDEPLLLVSVVEDIDDRRRAILALEEAKADLERTVAERTAALGEKTLAEHALARSEAQFRGAFESAAVGQVHYHPTTGRIIRANRAHAHMLGYEPEELVGCLGRDFTHPDDRDGSKYWDMMHGGATEYAREKRYRRKDGSYVWGRVSATVVREPETGEPVLAMAVIEDIDDRYRAIQALEEAKSNLERVVDERTAALVQRDLLLREVYHRVKNNLQVVDSLLLLQARRLADPDGRSALENLRSRVYALGLVHHQLMGSKDLETFDIAPFLEELSRHLLEGGGRTGITLSVRAAPLSVGLDFAIPLGLLVTELVTNSMKHAFPAGEGAVEVALDWVGANELVLSVGDDGVGYNAAAKPPTTTLGASIIDGLVRQLRGQMTVTADAGTRTVVRLPAPGGSA